MHQQFWMGLLNWIHIVWFYIVWFWVRCCPHHILCQPPERFLSSAHACLELHLEVSVITILTSECLTTQILAWGHNCYQLRSRGYINIQQDRDRRAPLWKNWRAPPGWQKRQNSWSSSHYWDIFKACALEVSQYYKVTVGTLLKLVSTTMGGLLQLWMFWKAQRCAMAWEVIKIWFWRTQDEKSVIVATIT